MIEAPDGARLLNVNSLAEETLSNTDGKPANHEILAGGIIAYDVVDISIGASINVKLTFPTEIPANSKVFKVTDSGYAEFPNAVIDGNTVTLTLTDGGEGDADGIANGVIDDPVAVLTPTTSNIDVDADTSNTNNATNDVGSNAGVSDDSSGNNGGGGSTDAPWVLAIFLLAVLRQLSTRSGRE